MSLLKMLVSILDLRLPSVTAIKGHTSISTLNGGAREQEEQSSQLTGARSRFT